ncbi:MAG: hypothetical protein ACQET8_03330 [Bacillota bacterium]|uniref:hypothetical protein n=1 Tax=Fictibacillus TaxID=1329200 RepID=UPI001642849F|nr:MULTISPECIES: hypothetical protein [Fictibacillus]MBH0168075.1 hypothetical protein [Fictibacillus sp. 18YEL24]
MTLFDSFYTAIAIVFIQYLFERMKYKGTPLKRTGLLIIEVIIFTLILFYGSKIFN